MEIIEKNIEGAPLKIYVGSSMEPTINDVASGFSGNFAFVSRTVNGMYRTKINKMNFNKIYMKDGESVKSMRYFTFILRKLIERNVERDNNIAYIGGGTLGDLVGYSSSVFKRGVHLTAIPTTLLSQIDSSIGGKNAIDFMGIKNVIGTFYQPNIIIDDIDFLINSPASLLKEGMAEALKMAVIGDRNLFDYLMANNINSIHNYGSLANIISKSIKIKLDIVSKDFYDEQKIRYLLNFGHSIGHAIEAYSNNAISHGTAVANGMVIESYIAYKAGYSSPLYDLFKEAAKRYGIDLINFKSLEIDALLRYIKNDKKVENGALNMVMLLDKGNAEVNRIDFASLRRYLNMYSGETC
ncbi:MAG: 3-dehydroquinate synthase family protein [Ferroplasma sp.]